MSDLYDISERLDVFYLYDKETAFLIKWEYSTPVDEADITIHENSMLSTVRQRSCFRLNYKLWTKK